MSYEAVAMHKGEYDSLQHHGILGMKWGIRRYQNKDGSLTQKGMARYNKNQERYKNSSERYRDVVRQYHQGEVDRKKVQSARRAKMMNRFWLAKSRRNLKNAYRADHGQELVERGHTKTKEALKYLGIAAGTTIASKVVFSAVARSLINRGAEIVTAHGNIPAAVILAPMARVAAGAAGTAAMIAVHPMRNLQDIKRYEKASGKKK